MGNESDNQQALLAPPIYYLWVIPYNRQRQISIRCIGAIPGRCIVYSMFSYNLFPHLHASPVRRTRFTLQLQTLPKCFLLPFNASRSHSAATKISYPSNSASGDTVEPFPVNYHCVLPQYSNRMSKIGAYFPTILPIITTAEVEGYHILPFLDSGGRHI